MKNTKEEKKRDWKMAGYKENDVCGLCGNKMKWNRNSGKSDRNGISVLTDTLRCSDRNEDCPNSYTPYSQIRWSDTLEEF